MDFDCYKAVFDVGFKKKKSNTKSGLNTKLVTVFFYFSNISNIYIGQIYKQIVIVIHVRF